MNTIPLRRAGRPCVKQCVCGSPAIYSIQVMARTVGPGQSFETRQTKLGPATYVCGGCSRKVSTFIRQLEESSQTAVDRVMNGESRPLPKVKPAPLFQ